MAIDPNEKLSRILMIALGVCAIGFGIVRFDVSNLTPLLAALLLFAVVIAPRASIPLPGTDIALTFSDACIYLAFLFYGGPTAILFAGIETTANCLYLYYRKGFRFQPYMVPFNIALNVVSFTAAYLIWTVLPSTRLVTGPFGSVQHLIVTLGTISVLHFVIASSLLSFIRAKNRLSEAYRSWRKDFSSRAMMHIVGAGLAALVYMLATYGDILTAVISAVGIAIVYFSYRRSVQDLKEAMLETEAAQKEKAETERMLRREAEVYASELAVSLESQERANIALRKSEQNFQHAALHDALTGLANRKLFHEKLMDRIAAYRSDNTAAYHVLFLDLARFKNINDSLGHTIGDKVLSIAARRFLRLVTPADMVARLGGDEFAIVLKGPSTAAKAKKVAQRIHSSISQPFSLSGNRISISVNIGIAPADMEYTTPEEVLRDADIAMNYAKAQRESVALFTRDLRTRFLERVRLEMDLSHAIERGELSMSYQPLVRISDGKLLGFESLLRWNHGEFGNIPPARFIPIAEDSGLIIPITKWILRETTDQMAEWRKISAETSDILVSVNISGKHLSSEDLVYDIECALERSRLAPEALKLEITESTAMDNPEFTLKLLKDLKRLGVQLSLDDFGTGYSSLSILHKLPFDTIKIDRSFVSGVGPNGEDSEIIQTIISLAKNLRMKVIAEGIETQAQLSVLKHLGCDYGQGYLLAKPMTAAKAEAALYAGRGWLPYQTADNGKSANAEFDRNDISVF
ncbi:MAG TPA: EAL domain-containing protein [Pyrinomonadaceae bacterium]|nr:EAL domain-containing protein [Pyrinomonadaceae bacterium]